MEQLSNSCDTPMNHYQFPRISSTILLLNKKNEVFLMRRSKNTRNDQGLWSIPGGAIESQETVEASIARESTEEVGITIKNPKYLGYINHLMPEIDQHWVSHAFVAYEWVGEPVNMEPLKCDEVMWCSIKELPEDTSRIVKEAIALLKKS